LDWIVMKCLEKDRNRRYETANGLARDIERHLHGEPVQACPPSAWYRFRKFTRRNRPALAFAALTLLFLVLLGGGLGWVAGDRAARQQVQETEAGDALNQAARCLEEGKWPEAAAWAQRAEGVLAGGAEQPAGRQRLQTIRADLDMVARLQEIRIRQSQVQDEQFDNLAAGPEFAQAFRGYGIDVEALDVEQAAAAIRARPVRLELVLALDDWAFVRQKRQPGASRWRHLLAVARAADRDPFRNQLRQALEQQPIDRPALERLAASDEVGKLPAPTLVHLEWCLRNAGAVDAAVRVLGQTVGRYPSEFWVNEDLAYCLSRTRPPRWQEALRFYMAARALRPQSPGVRLNLGVALAATGDLEGAIAAYEEAIHLKPDYATAYYNRGNAYRLLGRREQALADYTKAIELRPDHTSAWYNRGNAYRLLGQKDRALADYTRAVALNPGYAKAWCNRGVVYAALGQNDRAIADYTKAIELEPGNATTWYDRGNSRAALGQREMAVADLTKALELKPDFANAWLNRGIAHYQMGQRDRAIADYTKAIECKPDLAEAWHHRGNTYRRMGKLDKAIADYSRALEFKPDYVQAWNNRGVTYRQQGEPAKAVADYTRALEVKPGYVNAWNNRGAAYLLLGLPEKAVADCTRAIELRPKFVNAWINRGEAHRALRRWDKAITDYSRAVEMEPKNGTACNKLASLLACCPESRLRDPRRAVELATKATQLQPKAGPYWNTLGVAHYRAGSPKEAVAALKKSMRLRKGGDTSDWFFLAMAHWQLGDEDRARKWYDRAVQQMDKDAPRNEELRRIRAEAAEVMKTGSGDRGQGPVKEPN
jgi:tetratricopeptide (TPR) repeat protein